MSAHPAAPSREEGSPAPIYPGIAPVCAPEHLRTVALPNTTIESVATVPAENAVRVTAIVTHPPAKDRVTVWIALPMGNWNGRFRGNGGGGFSGGSPDSLRAPVAQGYATGATDAGHEGGSGSFALNANGRLNWQEIRDFAYLGIHDMTVVGKALAAAFYGKAPRYSYFVGSSTGGRQGLMEAQRYPEDYDGILAGCPAVNWQHLFASSMWPQLVMLEAKNFVSKAKLQAVTAACVAACDGDDGLMDGVLADPARCTWDPKGFIGMKVGDEVFTAADAEVVRKIWDGPRGHDGRSLWYGLSRGADLSALAGTEGTPLTGKPFSPGLDRLRYLLAQNPNWDWKTLTRDQFELFNNECVELFGPTLGSDDPDLTGFRDRGGKAIIYHGLADQLIPHQGSIAYYERVQQRMGGAEKTVSFARLFLVPGVDHGFRGAGASPSAATCLAAIVAWVEAGHEPERLLAEAKDKDGKVTRSRPLFPYPRFAKYSGTGNSNDAANFVAALPTP
jgi:feruloyl esterase